MRISVHNLSLYWTSRKLHWNTLKMPFIIRTNSQRPSYAEIHMYAVLALIDKKQKHSFTQTILPFVYSHHDQFYVEILTSDFLYSFGIRNCNGYLPTACRIGKPKNYSDSVIRPRKEYA